MTDTISVERAITALNKHRNHVKSNSEGHNTRELDLALKFAVAHLELQQSMMGLAEKMLNNMENK